LGAHAREFARRTDGVMVGINVGIPAPFSIFPFFGHKRSFFEVRFSEEDGEKKIST
jgi:malonate-semialdehyde dehydrogenase (acetylating)/methylmalonate-semialdehyde dehydrogenase